MGLNRAAPRSPRATLKARITPTGSCTDSKNRNLREIGVAFWTARMAIVLIQKARIKLVTMAGALGINNNNLS
jgi:hypothetical protein